ncbi:MAG: TIGR02300 family protein [Alphaproteobacteria bacterium]|nr:TIGR02300 family protein [Alphaproteobacteria bacterium]
MAKPEWGTKRKCLGCGAFFYDMRQKKWTCPKCGKEMTIEDFKEALAANSKNASAVNVKDMDDDALIDVVKDGLFEDTDEDLDILEDASDLSDDNHDMAEVMENVSIDDKEL